MRAPIRLLFAIILLPFLLLLRVVRRFLKVELCVVGAHRFGHLALEPEVYLNLLKPQSGWSVSRTLTLWSFGRTKIQSSKELASIWRREVGISPGVLVGALVRAGELCPPLALSRASMSIHGPQNVLDVTSSRLAKQIRGLQSDVLQRLGLRSGEFVCLVIRDGTYYAQTGSSESAGYELLNFHSADFVDACSRLVAKGLKVVRLGTPTPNRLGSIDGVIDYANLTVRSELNDLILIRECAFLVSTQTGPDAVGLALRKPVLYIDTVRLSQFFFGTKLATWNPVGFINSETGKPLSLDQLLNSQFKWLKNPEEFLSSGFSFERSSSSEIAEMVSSYVEERQSGASLDVKSIRDEVNRRMTAAFGERGQLTWGDVTANLNGWWLMKNKDWFL